MSKFEIGVYTLADIGPNPLTGSTPASTMRMQRLLPEPAQMRQGAVPRRRARRPGGPVPGGRRVELQAGQPACPSPARRSLRGHRARGADRQSHEAARGLAWRRTTAASSCDPASAPGARSGVSDVLG